MLKWILLSGLTVVTLLIWSFFFMTFFQGNDGLSQLSEVHPMRNDPVDEKLKVSLDGYGSWEEYITEYEDDTEELTNKTDKVMEEPELNEANQFPESKDGDAIGYGEGISINELLDRFSD